MRTVKSIQVNVAKQHQAFEEATSAAEAGGNFSLVASDTLTYPKLILFSNWDVRFCHGLGLCPGAWHLLAPAGQLSVAALQICQLPQSVGKPVLP